ncbi:phosphotransferase family protein [Streptomyces sp. NPDC088350]|uniref:phosphotransferase family protein n=1 Tax=Streptomyces sp. NPDC088350 TaxID=3365854 RepID=UPI00382C4D82
MPAWLAAEAQADGYEVVNSLAERVTGGVVAEIYCAFVKRNGRVNPRIYRRTPLSLEHATRLSASLGEIAQSYAYFPGEARFSVTGSDLISSYTMVPGDELAVTLLAAAELGRIVAALHSRRGYGHCPSIYDHVWDEAEAAMADGREEIARAGENVRAAGKGLLSELLDNSDAATHGDLTASNMIMGGNGHIILIDWDKFCSVSLELDLAIAAFAFSRNCDAEQLLEFQSEYLRSSVWPASRLLARAYDLVADVTLVHDWYMAVSTNRAARWSNVWDWCLPQWTTWQKRRAWLGKEA